MFRVLLLEHNGGDVVLVLLGTGPGRVSRNRLALETVVHNMHVGCINNMQSTEAAAGWGKSSR